jgi:hypothetical protein
LRIKMVGAGLLPYDAAREIEVISADNGSVSYVLEGDRVMLDASQLALAAQTLMGSVSAPAALAPAPAPALERQATPPRDLVQWAMSAPVSVGIAARIEALAAMASPEPTASAQMLATPEFLSARSPAAEERPSSSASSPPPATEPAPAVAPAHAVEPSAPAAPNAPTAPTAPAAPAAPSVRQQAPESGQAPASDQAEQERSAAATADVAAAAPVALRWGSLLVDMFTRLKSLATGSRPAQGASPVAEAIRPPPVQAPSHSGAAASTESSSSRGGDAAPGA